jgi:TonB-dependent receptor
MSKSLGPSRLLLITTALVMPAQLLAQTTAAPAPAQAPAAPPAAPAAAAEPPPTDNPAPAPLADPDAVAPDRRPDTTEEDVDVVVPGGYSGSEGEILVTARRSRDITRTSPQVLTVLSTDDIARTGEGDISGSLGRVTGLSVVGNGFVYIRGLGERYSLAMLNGVQLSSPEPLKRVVPLDLFPTEIIGSVLVQKSYSVNFPGEFGGGLINLTTRATPKEPYLTIGASIGGNTFTTNQLGFTYFGSATDWTGFDNGNRDLKPSLKAYLQSGDRISEGTVDTQKIASELVTGRNAIIQRNENIPANWAVNVSAGKSKDVGDGTLGFIGNFVYRNNWLTRQTIQQLPAAEDLSSLASDFTRVITDNRIVVTGLLGAAYDFGEKNQIRWTNLYIRDTLKTSRLGEGTRPANGDFTFAQQNTGWFERQLFTSQLIGEFKLNDQFRLDARAAYTNTQRESPDEFNFEYARSNDPADPFRDIFVNRLNNGQRGAADVAYSNLDDNLWNAGADLSWQAIPEMSVNVGYAYTGNFRTTERREFLFIAPGTFPSGVATFRPDFLLQPDVINFWDIALVDSNEANPVFDSELIVNAGYLQFVGRPVESLLIDAGIRFESGQLNVNPVQVFNTPTASLAGTSLSRDYWLPALTATWFFADRMQLRFNISQTIARPQFRELIFQPYYDPDANRTFRGNPLLEDSELFNLEARWEWYFETDQKVALAGFYKTIDNPIETTVSISGENTTVTTFANAPRATLYGAELEVQKYFFLDGIKGDFWATRRAVAILNYTYTNSNLEVGPDDPVRLFASSVEKATDLFRDGSPLTGQSDHIANLQLGLEDVENLSQQTFLLSYASGRVTSRGIGLQPDVIAYPGFILDFVARQGFEIGGQSLELKFEVRNITGTKYQEYQQSGDNRVYYNLWEIGTTFAVGARINF